MSDANFPPDKRNVSVGLWRHVHDLICIVFNLCGDPADLAQAHTLTLHNFNLFLPWIRAGEALLRRFLIMEAALLPTPAGAPATAPARSSKPRAKHAELDPDPNNWPVSFRFAVPARSSASAASSVMLSLSKQTRTKTAPRFRAAIPLARRLEALLRVYNNPLPYAQRLAARLRKSAAALTRLAKDGWESFRNKVGDRLYDAILPLIAEAIDMLRNPTPATNTS